jgi:hypothetical protein
VPRLGDQLPVLHTENLGIAKNPDQCDGQWIDDVLRSRPRDHRVQVEHRILDARVPCIELAREVGKKAVMLPPAPHASERPELNLPATLARDTGPFSEPFERCEVPWHHPALRDRLHPRISDAGNQLLECEEEEVIDPEIGREVLRDVVRLTSQDVTRWS